MRNENRAFRECERLLRGLLHFVAVTSVSRLGRLYSTYRAQVVRGQPRVVGVDTFTRVRLTACIVDPVTCSLGAIRSHEF
jgi:hypothetical protein